MSEDAFSSSIDRYKESFLYATAQGGNAEDCESLLKIGADVDHKHETDEDTPLLAACRRGHIDVAKILLVYGAKVTSRGADSMTPLHIAARRGDNEMINLLLDSKNTAINLKTSDGKTAWDIAKSKGYTTICDSIAKSMASRGQRAPIYTTASNTNNNNNAPTRSNSSDNRRIETKNEDRRGETSTSNTNRAESKASVSEQQRTNDRPSSKAEERNLNDLISRTQSAMKNVRDLQVTEITSTSTGANAARKVVVNTKIHTVSTTADSKQEGSNTRNTPQVKSSSGSSSQTYQIQGMSDSKSEDDGGYIDRDMLVDMESFKSRLRQTQSKLIELEQQNNEVNQERDLLRYQLEEAMIEQAVCNKETDTLKEQLLCNRDVINRLQDELHLLQGRPDAIKGLKSISDCEKVERVMKDALIEIEEHKNKLIKTALSQTAVQTESDRQCVICQSKPKTVLCLPCRHVCFCQECSGIESLSNCPLCREVITERINVYI